MKKLLIYTIFLIILSGCSSASIKNEKYRIAEFNKEKYLGKWYEIARKDHWFEKGLSNVTAEYSLKSNGEIEVKNKGYNTKKGKFETAIGSAKSDSKIENIFHVTFFKPFYADYIILDYDKDNYTYALIRSKGNGYLWILSRNPVMEKTQIDILLKKAENDGLTISDIIFVEQNKNTQN